MVRISVLGGTGHAGGAVVREAARRGHQVRAFSRNAPADPVPDAEYVQGSVLDGDVLAEARRGADVVFEAVSPRGDMAGSVEGLVDRLVELSDRSGVRLGALGGASSLLVSASGPALVEVAPPPPEVAPEVQTGIDKLAAFRASPESLDWFYVSPPRDFGAWFPEEVTGEYRLSENILLEDAEGRSYISAADLALAVLDEIERPRHRRRRFHAAH